MKAVVFKGPKKVELEDRPIPQIQDPTDIIVKVEYTALCGRYVHTSPIQEERGRNPGTTRPNDAHSNGYTIVNSTSSEATSRPAPAS
jgi:threonine dehydrogenase-like Zn-dependent dehydrogenase